MKELTIIHADIHLSSIDIQIDITASHNEAAALTNRNVPQKQGLLEADLRSHGATHESDRSIHVCLASPKLCLVEVS